MVRRPTFFDVENASHRRMAKRVEFLRRMDAAILRATLVELVKPRIGVDVGSGFEYTAVNAHDVTQMHR